MPFYSTANQSYYLAFGKQDSKGTAATAMNKVRCLSGITWEHGMDEEEIRETGFGKNPARSIKKIHKISGSMPLLARPDIVQQMLTYALGSGGAPAGTAAPYTHTIVPADTLPYLTLGIRDPKIERAIDAVIRELKISAEAAGEVKLEASWLGCNVTRLTSESGPMTASAYIDPSSATFKFSGGSYWIDGPSGSPVTSSEIKSYSLTYTNNVDEDEVTVNNYLDDIPFLNRSLAVEFLVRFDDQNLYNEVYFGSSGGTAIPDTFYQDGYFKCTHTFGSGSTLRELTIVIPKLLVTACNLTRLDPDAKTVELAVVAKAIEADPLITATVKNARSTIY